MNAAGEAEARKAPLPGAPGRSPFLPLLLLLVAAVGWSMFQCYQLWHEQQSLAAVHAGQQRPIEESGKLRLSLDAIARETALLADAGNPNAKLLVDELRRRGVRIDPHAAPVTPPGNANR